MTTAVPTVENSLTLELIRQEVLRLAEAHPEAVYHAEGEQLTGSCAYDAGEAVEPDGTVVGTGCLFGQALARLGHPVTGGHSLVYVLVDLDVVTDTTTPAERCLLDQLDRIQTEQDRGLTWREAVTVLQSQRTP